MRSYVEPREGAVPWKSCPECPKQGFYTRADAKRVRRRVDPHMAVYRCPSGLFHLGHRRPGVPRTNYPSQWERGQR